jgi:hypothetical protein
LPPESGAVKAALSPNEPAAAWQAVHDRASLYLNVACAPSDQWRPLSVTIHVQSSHIYPRRTFQIDANGKQNMRLGWLFRDAQWDAAAAVVDGQRTFRFRIPFDAFDGEFDPTRPMCINVQVQSASLGGATPLVQTWAPLSSSPPKFRLGYGAEDPSEMGWLRIEP